MKDARSAGQSASDAELTFMTVADAAALIAKKKLSPVELVRAHLDRISRVNSQINGYITVLDEQLRVCRGNAGTLFALLRRDDLAVADLL